MTSETIKNLDGEAGEASDACGFEIVVKKDKDGKIIIENGKITIETDIEHEKPFVLASGAPSAVSSFLDGYKKGCKSMYFTTTEKGAERLMKDFSSLLNRASARRLVDPMYMALVRDHRTLQQNFWRVISNLCDKYAGARFDPRNEGSVNFCKMVKGIGNGKILKDAASDCLEKLGERRELKGKCNDIREKYKNKTIIGLCTDVDELSGSSSSCNELENIATGANVPVYLPFI